MDINSLDMSKLIPLLIPIILLQFGMQIWAVIDLIRRPATKGPKWIWIVVILALEIFGPVIYFLFGREET